MCFVVGGVGDVTHLLLHTLASSSLDSFFLSPRNYPIFQSILHFIVASLSGYERVSSKPLSNRKLQDPHFTSPAYCVAPSLCVGPRQSFSDRGLRSYPTSRVLLIRPIRARHSSSRFLLFAFFCINYERQKGRSDHFMPNAIRPFVRSRSSL
jgi:hypothetical protein